ncbi:MAG: hypothetical protein ROW48_07310 [Bellilinea sp.]|jgi:hypothetical protein
MFRRVLYILIISVFLTSCQSETNNEFGNTVPTPEQGKSNLTGRIMTVQGKPLTETVVRLAEVYRDGENTERGAYLLDTAFSPGTITDNRGFFVFINLLPGEYVVVVGDVESNNYVIIADEKGIARTWKTMENQILDLGKLVVEKN